MTSDPAVDRARVWRKALSIGIATAAYGLSFGALSVSAGLSVLQTCVLSLLLFSGGSQFAFVGVVGAGGSGLAAAAAATLLGVRNGFYSLQLAPLLRPGRWRRPLAAQLTLDESTAVAVAEQVADPDRPDLARLGFWVTGAGIYLGWNATTLVGALLGDLLGDPRRFGLDAAAAAAFLALVWPRLTEAEPALVAAAAAVVALAAVPFVPAGVPVLLAAVVAVVAGSRGPRSSARSSARPSAGEPR